MKVDRNVAALAAIVSALIVTTQADDSDTSTSEAEGTTFIYKLDDGEAVLRNKAGLAKFAYYTNITKETQDNYVQTIEKLNKEEAKLLEGIEKYKWQTYKDPIVRRMFQKYSEYKSGDQEEETRLRQVNTDMETTYETFQVCSYKDRNTCDLELDSELIPIFASSRDPDELKYYWEQWHKVGAKIRQNFTEYVTLYNKAVQPAGFKNVAEFWLSRYEADSFEQQLVNLWEELRPLYQQLHAFVRRKLREQYGDLISPRGPIPAHLLGNIWAQSWSNIESFTQPFPGKQDSDISKTMRDQNYSPLIMFQMADEFFRSLNLPGVNEKFWKHSIIEKKEGIQMGCQPTSWDMSTGDDFRINMCTTVTFNDLKVVHHEMGHIQYFTLYSDQPNILRAGANPGFQEAVGDMVALSVSSRKHLKRVGLLTNDTEDQETEINQLYKMGIDKIAYLPFAYLLDLFRYNIFRGITGPEDYNCEYWYLRETMQGVEPPVPRTEEDFDAGAKYHIPASVEYARYFIAIILQFQFHEKLCLLANEYDPNDPQKKLVDCDIYQSAEAGKAFAAMMKLGASKPWPDAMEAITGQRDMLANGFVNYFKPLLDYLTAENEKTGEYIGWEHSKIQYCTAEQLAKIRARESKKL